MRHLVVVLILLTTCRSAPPRRPLISDDHDRLIALMGGIDAHLLGLQGAVGDPIEPDLIRAHLAAILGNLEKACGLDVPQAEFRGKAGGAMAKIQELKDAEWTPGRRQDYYKTLRSLCADCHREFAPPLSSSVRKPNSWETCGRCHERVYMEWGGTLHAHAWKDPVYRMSAGDPPAMECRSCHSMKPVLEREISADVTYRPVYRPYLQEEGVNCLACHGLADGSVAAARDVPDAPCRPRRDERLGSPVFCGACHNPTHAAYDEWKLSKSGKSCAECHAHRDGRFTHRMRGVSDPEFVKSALDWACDVKEGELRVTLTNRSGHKLPAEVPSRTLRLVIAADDREETLLLRRPNKQIVGEKDSRLLPDETRVIRRSVAGAKAVRVDILYQQSPFAMPEEWIRIGRWEKAP